VTGSRNLVRTKKGFPQNFIFGKASIAIKIPVVRLVRAFFLQKEAALQNPKARLY
jgi:hypothetical protein